MTISIGLFLGGVYNFYGVRTILTMVNLGFVEKLIRIKF